METDNPPLCPYCKNDLTETLDNLILIGKEQPLKCPECKHSVNYMITYGLTNILSNPHFVLCDIFLSKDLDLNVNLALMEKKRKNNK